MVPAFSPRTKMALIPALLVTLMVGGVGGLLTATFEIENQARMVTIGIEAYWDVTATKLCESIDWGSLRPGEAKTVTIYVKNTGDDPITGSFTLMNWDPPEAADFISLEWDFGNVPLRPQRIRTTHFTLTVSPSIQNITNFYFVIQVTGTQVQVIARN